MNRRFARKCTTLTSALAAAASLSSPALALPTIWTSSLGKDVTFTKTSHDGNAVAADVDWIIPTVGITRNASKGLYNTFSETHFVDENGDPVLSPAGTEWAFSDLNNPHFLYGQGAASYAQLTFDVWEDSLGGQHYLVGNIIDRPGVLHLINDNIYIDIEFSSWAGGGSGGGFSYTRAAAPAPEPASLAILGLPALLLCRRNCRPAAPRPTRLTPELTPLHSGPI